MGVLTLASAKIIDSVLPDQTWVNGNSVFKSCIGKEVYLELTINSSEILYDAKLYYNPALFTFRNRKPDSYNENPEGLNSYFLLELDHTTDFFTNQAQFYGEATQRNYTVTYRLVNERKQLIIKHRFFMTADVAGFLTDIELENRNRLLRSNIFGDTDGDYLGIGSIYNQYPDNPQYLSINLYAERIKSDFQIWVKSGGFSIKRLDGGSFVTDGHTNGDGGFLYKEKFNDNRYDLVNASSGTVANVTASTMDFVCTHSYQLTTGYVYVSGLMTQTDGIGGVVYYKDDDTEEPQSSVLQEQFRLDADWYGLGDFSYQSFEVVGRTDNNLSLNSPNTIKFNFLYDGTVSFVDFWLVKKTNVGNDLGFLESLGNHYNGLAVADTLTNIGGSLWETTWKINDDLSIEDESYHIVAVFSDAVTGKVGSLISPELGTDNVPDVLAIPTIQSTFKDYKNTFTTNALNAHPYDRYKACIRLDKSVYNNLLTTQGGSFDANIRSIKVTFAGNIYSLTNTGIRKWQEQSGSKDVGLEYNADETDKFFYAEFRFRALPDWIGATRNIDWEIRFDSEPEYLFFTQKIAVQDFDTTFFTDLEIRDMLDAPISSFYENEGNVKLFGEITDDSNVYMLAAIIDNNGDVREWEEETSETLLQRQDNDYNNNVIFSNVDQQFDGSEQAEYTFKNNILESNSYAVMIAKRKDGEQTGIDYMQIETDFTVQ